MATGTVHPVLRPVSALIREIVMSMVLLFVIMGSTPAKPRQGSYRSPSGWR